MDAPNTDFALAGSLEDLKTKGRLVLHGAHRPILVVYDRGRVFALANRCPHMGFPLDRGSAEGIVMSGRRPLIKGYLSILRGVAGAVMSSAFCADNDLRRP